MQKIRVLPRMASVLRSSIRPLRRQRETRERATTRPHERHAPGFACVILARTPRNPSRLAGLDTLLPTFFRLVDAPVPLPALRRRRSGRTSQVYDCFAAPIFACPSLSPHAFDGGLILIPRTVLSITRFCSPAPVVKGSSRRSASDHRLTHGQTTSNPKNTASPSA